MYIFVLFLKYQIIHMVPHTNWLKVLGKGHTFGHMAASDFDADHMIRPITTVDYVTALSTWCLHM